MAKAVRATSSPRARTPALPAQTARGNYLKEVWDELKKVLWPTRTELTRMTGIVIATVFIFAGIIGIADYGLGLVVRQLYAAPGTARTNTVPAGALPRATGAPIPAPSGAAKRSAPRTSAPAAPGASAPAAAGASAPAAAGASAPAAAGAPAPPAPPVAPH